ncbi:hypothetical protein NC652_031778 [Populus alba x Populus x berolinensis]|nr:hypothetical protein NC652_031778 [Populus alba x Populus x berolinensis]
MRSRVCIYHLRRLWRRCHAIEFNTRIDHRLDFFTDRTCTLSRISASPEHEKAIRLRLGFNGGDGLISCELSAESLRSERK